MDNQTKEIENNEWIASLNWLIEHESDQRVQEIIQLLQQTANKQGIDTGHSKIFTDYVNSISKQNEKAYPGDLETEKKIFNATRWNAMAMVVNANKKISGIGGHISTYSSVSNLFEVGFNHFFKGYEQGSPDIVYFQGHAAPGVYARSFLEYRLDEEALNLFRQEIFSEKGLSSYPHPKSMPEYWRYPTVSMGLAPIQAIYQARFLKYLENRNLTENNGQKVWAFLGDGEMEEPESTGALSIAKRDNLNNLIFVVNCNLQRLDGPVRGNSKIITELEGLFKGAQWNVIKLLWNQAWDPLFEKDTEGILKKKLAEMPDGQLQKLARMNGEELKESFFNKDEGLKKLAAELGDEALNELGRGGHDEQKIFNAYKQAVEHKEGPTVILVQSVKGHLQGDAGEASNVTHQQKKFNQEQLQAYRDTFEMPFTDDDLSGEKVPFYRFEKSSGEFEYLKKQREKLQGWLPKRENMAKALKMPENSIFENYNNGSNEKPVTTTSVFVQVLSNLIKDKNVGESIVPIIPDESRTFGMDALFSKAGIYAAKGQNYEPVDKGSLLFYNESKKGIILEEGITEAGAMSSFMAAGNNHLVKDFYTIPFFVFYSMFGLQRVGDLVWAASDAGTKGFMVGGISGRTSLSGEGLQHADGQSHLYAMAYPNLKAYDPAFAYELATIIKHGIKKMFIDDENLRYYLTITNQAYIMPPKPDGIEEEDILNGLYLFKSSDKRYKPDKTVNLMGSGAIMSEVLKAAEVLEGEFNVPTNIWSVTSYKSLLDEAVATEQSNLNHLKNDKNTIQSKLENNGEVFIAATDFVKAIPLTIAKWIPGSYTVLGTDGFGLSDSVHHLRDYFKVNASHIVQRALTTLSQKGRIKKKALNEFDDIEIETTET